MNVSIESKSSFVFEEKDEVDMKFFLFCFLFFLFLMGMDREMEGEEDWRKDLRKKKDDMWIQYCSIEITLKVERLSPLINWVDGREEKVCAFYFTRNDLFGRKRF